MASKKRDGWKRESHAWNLTWPISVNKMLDGVNQKFDAMNDKVDRRLAAVDAKIDRLRDSLASAIVWAVTLYVASAGALLGTLARGFGCV